MIHRLIIYNNKNMYSPIVEGEITWETQREGTPGKLIFNVLKDEILQIENGNAVSYIYDETKVFFGFIFALEYSKNKIIKVIAYDQLRYLKYKDTYVYTNKKASDVIKMVAKDSQMNLGVIADTEYIIPSRSDDNATRFDVIQNALDLTLVNKGKMYILYDKFGELTLANIDDMKIPPKELIVGKYKGEDFSYKVDIDGETYNQIKLIKENEKTGKRDVYLTNHAKNIARWGLLQYYEVVDKDSTIDPKTKAEKLLELYNREGKSLQLKNQIGDLRVRAGSGVYTILDTGEKEIAQYMLVEKASHTFKNGEHFMTLDIRGDI